MSPLHDNCPSCIGIVSDICEFVFGWGHPNSNAWKEFNQWVVTHQLYPAWTRFIKPTNRSMELWSSFSPERDPEDPYKKEEYREWLGQFFKHMISRASDLDHLLFVGYQQQGADPIPCLAHFKEVNGLETWSSVSSELGKAFLKGANLHETYRRETMGNEDAAFWLKLKRHPLGQSYLNAIKFKPIRGRAQWRTAFFILKACAKLCTDNLSFSKWLEQKGLVTQLKTEQWSEGQSTQHLRWRKRWARDPSTPWEGPELDGVFPGLGTATFEYVLRDLPFEGSLHLFKDDSTNWMFVSRSSLAHHSSQTIDPNTPHRRDYWQALYNAGIFDRYPAAVVNIAFYFMISQEEEMEFYWEDGSGSLQAYEYLPESMRAILPRNCNRIAHR